MKFSFWRKPLKLNSQDSSPAELVKGIPIAHRSRSEKSFTPEEISRAKSELRTTTIEKDIFADALTRLYEAAAEGNLTAEERDKLVNKYKDQIIKLDSSLKHDQKVLTLGELEDGRAELLKMFNDKFDEMNAKIEEFRKNLGMTPKEITEPKLSTTPSLEKETKPPSSPSPEKTTPTTPPAPKKSKADEILEKMREDLQKELEKLEQIEMDV